MGINWDKISRLTQRSGSGSSNSTNATKVSRLLDTMLVVVLEQNPPNFHSRPNGIDLLLQQKLAVCDVDFRLHLRLSG